MMHLTSRLTSLFLLVLPLASFSQQIVERVSTQSTFANSGYYNKKNNSILFLAVEVDQLKEEINAAVKVKKLATNEEVIVPQNASFPPIGWLDSAHVLIKSRVSGKKSLKKWRMALIRYNISTHKQDTLPSSWYTSDNSVGELLTADNRLFYTIAYGFEDMKVTYWMEYFVNSGEDKIIKKFDGDNVLILTYQYVPGTNNIIYVKSENNKKAFVRLSLSSGSETVIQTGIDDDAIDESSVVINGKLYFIVRHLPKDKSGSADWENVSYLIRSLDLETGRIRDVYKSRVEITEVSPYHQNQLLISVKGDLTEGVVNKKFDLPAGGRVSLDLDATSYLYALNLKP
jgi:hypothetical protein